jgi:hypothetical protein
MQTVIIKSNFWMNNTENKRATATALAKLK